MPDLRLTDAQVADVATYLTTLKGPAGDAAQGDARRRRRSTRCCSTTCEAVMPLRGGARRAGEDGPAAEAARARAARDQPLRLLQLPRHQGVRERRSRSAPTCRKRAASWSRGSTSRSSRHPAHSKLAWFRPEAARSAHLRPGPRAAAARQAAHAELRLQRGRERAAADGDHELPARDSAAGGAAAAIGERDYIVRGRALVHRRTASAVTSSKATAATT